MIEDIKTTLDRLKNQEPLTILETEDLLLKTYRCLDTQQDTSYNLCLAVICHVADQDPQDKMVQQLLYDCIIKSRIFLYKDLIAKRIENFTPHVSGGDCFAESFYTSDTTNTILTKPQKEIFDLFQSKRRLIISAPTSFGKTRIIKEIIAHNNYQHIALIMPTVSLLSEQYHDLKNIGQEYVVTKSSKIEVNNQKKYLLIFTPERMSIFLEENPDFKVDFFVMDEIYKADYKLEDDRFRVFSDILYQLAKTNADFYLIGPYLSDFSKRFRDRFKATWKRYDIEIVQKDYYSLDNISQRGLHSIAGEEVRIIGDKFKNLLRILSSEKIDGKFLIYRYQKQYVELTAKTLIRTWPVTNHNEELVDYLSQVVSPDWDLIACIKKGIAFHHGAMPRYIQDLIIDDFNYQGSDSIKYLICTTSLTEGVNTSAKNVILYDSKIGSGTALKTLDRKNIEGRAGRFMRHFIGRVIRLERIEELDDENNSIIEIESFDHRDPSNEALMQVDDDDLEENNLSKKEMLKARLSQLKIPYLLIKSNKFVNIDGQLQVIELLRKSPLILRDCYFESGIPSKDCLTQILSIIYDHLFSPREKGRRFKNDEMNKSHLLGLTKYYAYKSPNFAELLNSGSIANGSGSINSKIRYVFELISKYFEFVWPRYMKVFERLYNFVATESGQESIHLDAVISKLEYGTTEQHEVILKDIGLPISIIRKISSEFYGSKTFEDVQSYYHLNKSKILLKINNIERRVVERYL